MVAKAVTKAIAAPQVGVLDKLSLYFPKKKVQENRPIERLIAMGHARDRSVNYLVCDAILQYLDREEAK